VTNGPGVPLGSMLKAGLVICVAFITETSANCKVGDAKWQGPPVVTNSPGVAGKVKVDWSKAVYNPTCVDEYHLWAWKDGTTKEKGKKYTIRNNKVMDKEIDIQPCVFTNIGIESVEKDLFNTHVRESSVIRFNSADLPSFNVSLPDLKVSYYREPSTGEFSLSNALVSIPTKFITFSSCLKEIEISAERPSPDTKSSAKSTKAKTSTPNSTPSVRTRFFGNARQPGEMGPPSTMHWGHEEGTEDGSGFNPGAGSPVSSPGAGSGFNAGTALPTARPPSKVGNWNYETPAKPGTGVGGQGFNPGKGVSAVSPFSRLFLRMKTQPPKATVAKQSSPFPGETVMMKVPVEPCTPQTLTIRFIAKDGSELGRLPPLNLSSLADIPDYIPPPLSQIADISFVNGKPVMTVQRGSSVPESCLPQYMEAVDAFASRLEEVAEKGLEENKITKGVQQVEQKKVETVKREVLSRHGCLCASPQIKLELAESGGTKYKTIKADHKTEVFGVYLYQGMSEGRPYYKRDLEGRRLEKENSAATPLTRRKRFIGRVDGGGSTTTRRPWNYGVVGGAQVDRGYPRSLSSQSTSSRISSSSKKSTSLSRSSSSSSSSSKTWTNIPIQRMNSAPVPHYIYWDTKAKQWLVSSKVGSMSQDSEFGSVVGSKFQCPADGQEVWQVRTSSLRSGAGRWQEEPALKIVCLE